MWIAGFALFVMGIVFLIIYPINKRKNNRCSAETEGTLTRLVRRHNSDGALPSMHVYSYCVDGVEYELRSTALNKHVSEVGDTCPIWYDPMRPQVAQEFHYATNKAYNIVLGLGIAMLVLGVGLLIAAVAQ